MLCWWWQKYQSFVPPKQAIGTKISELRDHFKSNQSTELNIKLKKMGLIYLKKIAFSSKKQKNKEIFTPEASGSPRVRRN